MSEQPKETDGDGPLSLCTNDELWAEIRRRTDAAIFIPFKNIAADETDTTYYFHGPHPTIIGLLSTMRARLMHEYIKGK